MKKIERILKYVESQGIRLSVFERDAKLGNSYFSNTKKRGEDISAKMLERIRQNVPDHFYKIFPEAKDANDNVIEEHDPGYSQESPDVEKLREENAQLKAKLMESQEKIIKLQEQLLIITHPDQDHLGGISQTKRSG